MGVVSAFRGRERPGMVVVAKVTTSIVIDRIFGSFMPEVGSSGRSSEG